MTRPSPWWMPDRHADRRPFLLARARTKAALRAWFESQGFIEVETACLQVSPGNETHLHAFKTEQTGTDLARKTLYLHTSPEFAMKKLLAAGERRIFTFTPAFRNRERGKLHSAEFTMLEWYRAGASYQALWDDCARILAIAADAANSSGWTFRGKSCDPCVPPEVLTVDEAFKRYADIALSDTYDGTGGFHASLADRASARGISFGPDDTWADIFSRVLVEKIEPHLGLGGPQILAEYPAVTSALARRIPNRPAVAERFELYCCGVELANGFGELTDAAEQRVRLDAEMAEKARIYGERYPLDEDFLAALAMMPPASGCALGFDRLVMLATGATSVDQVIWTPLPE